MNYKTIMLLALSFFMINGVFAQFPTEKIKKKLNASEISMDGGNGDGVFKAKSNKTNKWGMYQYTYDGVNSKELIPMEYDSIRNFPFNGMFTAVYNDGKVGIYLSKWSYDDQAKQTVICRYDDYQRIRYRTSQYDSGTIYLAMKKDGKWGFVDWLTGEEKSEFIYNTTDDLPDPGFEQKSW